MRYDKSIETLEDYIKTRPQAFIPTLQKIRETIKKAAPEAEEAIRYSMPTFRFKNKNLVHFALHKFHYALYPAPSAIEKFSEELNNYNTSKGTIRFLFEEPIPYKLITQIVKFRVSETIKNNEKNISC